MLGLIVALAAQGAIVTADAAGPAPVNASAPLNPAAAALFDRDPMIKQWAVRIYDSNRDGWLTSYETQAALAGFKDLADGDRNGRVTTYEYDRARDFIAAR